jgi:hypothetical protein
MIFFANADGSVKEIIQTTPIYQNSNNASEVVLIAPYNNATVTVAFTLPNGINTTEYIMTAVDLGDYMKNKQNSSYAAYQSLLDKVVTEYAGILTVQFFIYLTGTKIRLATFATTVNIQPGVPVELPDIPSIDIYQQILNILAGVSGIQSIEEVGYDYNVDNGKFTVTQIKFTKSNPNNEQTPLDTFIVDVYARNGTVAFDELTPAQKESLKGEQGNPGPPGASGVYVGTNTPPDNANVWIDPNGTATTVQMRVVYTDNTTADFVLYTEVQNE